MPSKKNQKKIQGNLEFRVSETNPKETWNSEFQMRDHKFPSFRRLSEIQKNRIPGIPGFSQYSWNIFQYSWENPGIPGFFGTFPRNTGKIPSFSKTNFPSFRWVLALANIVALVDIVALADIVALVDTIPSSVTDITTVCDIGPFPARLVPGRLNTVFPWLIKASCYRNGRHPGW